MLPKPPMSPLPPAPPPAQPAPSPPPGTPPPFKLDRGLSKCNSVQTLELAAQGSIGQDLTDIVGFAAFRSLDDEALSMSLAHWRRLPPRATVPASQHFFLLFLRLDRWHAGAHYRFELKGEALRPESLEGATDLEARSRQAALDPTADAREGSPSVAMHLVLDRSPLPWANTGDPVLPTATATIAGWGIVSHVEAVNCPLHEPPPSPPPLPPPQRPPAAWLLPQPPPLPPPPPPADTSWALVSSVAASLLGVVGGLGFGAIATLGVCVAIRRRRQPSGQHRGRQRRQGSRPQGARAHQGRERVPTSEEGDPELTEASDDDAEEGIAHLEDVVSKLGRESKSVKTLHARMDELEAKLSGL